MADQGALSRLMRLNFLSAAQMPRRKPALIATVVLLIGVALSITASQWVRLETLRCAQSRFDTAASNTAVQVERRFAAYVEVLVGLRALFHSGEVSRKAFYRYTDALELKRQLPGFQVLNYAPYVPAASREAFEKAVQQDPSWPAHLRFSITPPGARDGYHPFTLVEPLAGNGHLLGRDIAAAPHVRAALEVARDTGKLTTSGKLIQVRGPQQRVGLALRLPVYRAGMAIDTLSQRRAAYLGSVGAGFLVAEMLANLPGVPPAVRVRFFEGGPEPIVEQAGGSPATQADRLVFDSGASGGGHQPAAAAKPGKPPAGDGFRRVQSFTLGDRLWEVEVSAPAAEVVQPFEQWLPLAILAAGIVISASLSGVLLGLMVSQRRAIALTHRLALGLHTSQRQLAQALALAKLGSWVLDPASGTIECSDEARRIYGLAAADSTLTLSQLLARVPEAMRAGLVEAVEQARRTDAPVEFEHAVQAADGNERWVRINLQRSADGGATTVHATVRDETGPVNATGEPSHHVDRP